MKRFFGFLISMIVFMSSCKKDDTLQAPYQGFPKEVGEIMINQCATSGCHNDASSVTAAGLNLSSWDKLFAGSSAGAAVIPFRPDQSFLTYFINTDSTAGVVLEPTMPFNAPALSGDQVKVISDWIAEGAPDYEGQIKWEGVQDAYFVANQGCDLVAKIDPQTGLIMRYLDIGGIPLWTENPHMLQLSPDGKYFYAVFLSNNPNIEVYSTATDSLIAQIPIGFGDWNTLSLSPDGKYAYSVAFNAKKIAIANLENFTLEGVVNTLALPHGSTVHPNYEAVYVTQQIGNFLYKYEITSPPLPSGVEEISLQQHIASPNGSNFNAHEVAFTPDGSKYMLSCQGTHEVRIFDAVNDSLLAAIPVGELPSEFAFSKAKKLAFVTCMEDTSNFPGQVGSVAIIDYESLTLVKHVHTGTQPHGLIVDDLRNQVVVANRNQNQNGPAPHHSSECGGRNGYITLIDLNSLNLVEGFKMEVSVDPYSIAGNE